LGHFGLSWSLHGSQLVGLAVQPVKLKTSSDGSSSLPNIDGSVGLGWERWIRKNTVRVAASFMFEASQWFNANHLYHFEPGHTTVGTQNIPVSQPDEQSGNLGLMGFSLNLQVDF
jgi:hypothetical protein